MIRLISRAVAVLLTVGLILPTLWLSWRWMHPHYTVLEQAKSRASRSAGAVVLGGASAALLASVASVLTITRSARTWLVCGIVALALTFVTYVLAFVGGMRTGDAEGARLPGNPAFASSVALLAHWQEVPVHGRARARPTRRP